MLPQSLGSVVQADREREITQDLRNRELLFVHRDPRATTSAGLAVAAGRNPVRPRGTGA